MSKHIIPFVNDSNWQSNDNCDVCELINEKYISLLNSPDNENTQKSIFLLNRDYVVDGYGIVNLKERLGQNLYGSTIDNPLISVRSFKTVPDGIHKRKEYFLYNNYNVDLSNELIDEPSIYHSRWCAFCGARKPDIYDSNKEDIISLIKAKNFYINLTSYNLQITWDDIDIIDWGKSELYKIINFQEKIFLCENLSKNVFSESPFIDINIQGGNVYNYLLYTYNKDNTLIHIYESHHVLVPDNINTVPEKVHNLNFFQEQCLMKNSDGLYEPKQQIYFMNTVPCDIMISMDECGFPNTHSEGELYENPLYIGTNEHELNFDHTYFIRFFSKSEKKYREKYYDVFEPYYNYNDIDFSAIEYKLLPFIESNQIIEFIPCDLGCKIKWEDSVSENWNNTVVIIKQGDEPILNIRDGVIIDTIIIKNNYKDNYYIINNLNNNQKYYVGIFPVSNNNVNNVDILQQEQIIPGNYIEEIIINSYEKRPDLFAYMGRWKWSYDSFLQTDIISVSPNTFKKQFDLCILKFNGSKYGGELSFDYQFFGDENVDIFEAEVNDSPILSKTINSDWKNFKFTLYPDIEYSLKFMVYKNSKRIPNLICKINNIKVKYNSF